jgi:hypothetical protein
MGQTGGDAPSLVGGVRTGSRRQDAVVPDSAGLLIALGQRYLGKARWKPSPPAWSMDALPGLTAIGRPTRRGEGSVGQGQVLL